jgi:hypothetical protein
LDAIRSQRLAQIAPSGWQESLSFFALLAVFVCFSIKELPFGPWLANHRFLNKKYRACDWIID